MLLRNNLGIISKFRPEYILGAYKVNSHGEIVGDFLPNPNYKKRGNG